MLARCKAVDDERAGLPAAIAAAAPGLRAFAFYLTRSNAGADDLMQETVLRALANIDSFEPGTNMNAWLSTIMRNHHHSVWRRRKREVEWDPALDDSLGVSVDPAGAGEGPDLAKLVRVIAALAPEQRDALVAVGYLGIAYEDVAARLGVAIGTIKSRVARARARAAELMADFQVQADLGPMRRAAAGVSTTDSYYPIARALQDLCKYVSADEEAPAASTEVDVAWERLVDSGALSPAFEDFH